MSVPDFKIFDLSQAPGAKEAAPEGYDWAALPMGLQPRALICHQCAALIGIPRAHTTWHDALKLITESALP